MHVQSFVTFRVPLRPQKCLKLLGDTMELTCHAQAQLWYLIKIFTSVNMGVKFPEFLCIRKVWNVSMKWKLTQEINMVDFLSGEKLFVQNDESNYLTEFHEHPSNFIPTWPCVLGRYGAHWPHQAQSQETFLTVLTFVPILVTFWPSQTPQKCKGPLDPWHFCAWASIIVLAMW